MPAFPRSAGAMPRLATPPRFPFGLQSWGGSGHGQTRAVKNAGRVWKETYPLLDTQNPSVRALLETLNRSIRSGLVWDIQHPYWHVRKGVGGGSAVTHSPIQLIVNTENFAAWAAWVGTVTRTGGQADPFGGSAAYLLTDDDAASGESIRETPVFTFDGTKEISLFIRAGSATKTEFGLWDSTVSAWRHLVRATWSGGVPSVASIVSSGVINVEVRTGGWYRVSISTPGVIAANTNNFLLYPVGNVASDVGTVFVFGANAWEASVPAPYRGPSSPGPLSGPGVQDGSTLYVRGAPVSTTAWLRQGDMIDLPGSPVVLDVTAQVDTDANGGAQIPISPPVFTRYYIADNVAVTTDPTLITFSAVIDGLETPPGMDSTRYLQAGLTVTWREVLP